MAQFGYPHSDNERNNWTTVPVSPDTYFDKIDEAVRDDLDYIQAPIVAGESPVASVRLKPLDRADVAGTHTLHSAWVLGANRTAYIELWCDCRLMVRISHFNSGVTGFYQFDDVLSLSDTNGITNYDSLWLRFYTDPATSAKVTWANLEVPNALASTGTWLMNDSGPVPLAMEFAAAQAAAAWGWFGLPAAGEGSAFAGAASPWAYDFSVTPYYMWTAQAPPVGGFVPRLQLLGVG